MELSRAQIPPRCSEAPPSRGRLWPWALPVLLGAAAVLFWFDPSQAGFYPVCYFHELTGLWCPGCGSLRALHQLLHGNLSGALRYNALLVLSLPLLVWLAWRFTRGTGASGSGDHRIRLAWLWTACAVAVAFGILRNLPFAHWAWLVP